MPNVNNLSTLAIQLGLNFTGPIEHAKIIELAQAWLPGVNFHEDERFHSIDLEELYTVPADDFAGFNDLEQQDFAIDNDGLLFSPPVVLVNGDVRGQGATVKDALLEEDVHKDAVYTHGGNLRAAEKFFGSETLVPGPGNPRRPRENLRARAEFRMLLETLKQDLALAARAEEDDKVDKPIDAIWGEFDVTDLLLRRVNPDGTDKGPASRSVRHDFALELIQEYEAGNFSSVQALLQSPQADGQQQTRANETVWLALSTCGLLEYHFIYAYNDFHRYGGFFTNEHEGDNEGCCLVFEREKLVELQSQSGNPTTVAPLGLITSVHNESNCADESRSVDEDPGDARDGLDVYVARGSHATYLTAGTHDFFDISDLAREKPGYFALALLSAPLDLLLLVISIMIIYEHFNGDPDETSDDGVSGQAEVNPASDPDTHLPIELIVTALSDITKDQNNVYDLSTPDAAALALRAFRGRLGAHNGTKDESPRWENKTRRYFKSLVQALGSGKFRTPVKPIVVD